MINAQVALIADLAERAKSVKIVDSGSVRFHSSGSDAASWRSVLDEIITDFIQFLKLQSQKQN